MEAEIQNPLVTKLSHFAPLSEEDKEILEALCANPERFDADATVVQEDEVPSSGFVLTRGMACRYRNLPDGRRQILTFLLPEILLAPEGDWHGWGSRDPAAADPGR